jgi:NADH-quinone oxidoreductase subunit D
MARIIGNDRDNILCAGTLIADVPAIVGSLDIVMGEIDR